MLPALQSLAQIFSERLLNTAAEGFLLTGLVWAGLRLVPRQNSGTRFVVWFSTLLGIIALPFFSGSGLIIFPAGDFTSANARARIVLSSSWALYLFAAWVIGAGILLLRLAVGMWRVHLFRRKCSALNPANLDAEIANILQTFSRRRVKLCVSSDATVPAAIGFFRPAIVFPAWLVPQLSAEEIRIIVLHELAHLRRWDDWTNLAQKILRAVFFFHPAVWWIESRLTLEREMACDDMVLAKAASPRAYATSLISFAEKLHGTRGLALAQALVSRMQQMSVRVAEILDAERPSRPGLWKPVVAMSVAMLALVLAATPYMPRVVAFAAQPQSNTVRQMQTTAATIRPVMIRPVTPQPTLSQQALAIPAAFHPSVATVPLRMKANAARRPPVLRASATQRPQLPVQETIFIMRTARVDASGSGVWTLCVWKISGTDRAQRQLESAILMGLI